MTVGKSEPVLTDLMGSSEVKRNLYPEIEPYSTGFLKVSDLHTIYWEQSGNPDGHVSTSHSLSLTSKIYLFAFSLYYLTSFLLMFCH